MCCQTGHELGRYCRPCNPFPTGPCTTINLDNWLAEPPPPAMPQLWRDEGDDN